MGKKVKAKSVRYIPERVIQNKNTQLLDGVDFKGKSCRALKLTVILNRAQDPIKPPQEIKLHVSSTESGTWKAYQTGNYYGYSSGRDCLATSFGTHGTMAHVFFIPGTNNAHSVKFMISLSVGNGAKEYVTSVDTTWRPQQGKRGKQELSLNVARGGAEPLPPRQLTQAELDFVKLKNSTRPSRSKAARSPFKTADAMMRLDPATIIGGVAALYPVVREFLKEWFTGSTPVDMAPYPLYANVGDVIRIQVWDADDYCSVLMNDKLCGGAGKGDQVQFLGDTVSKGANLILCKLSNQFPVQMGVDIWACRDGQRKWELHFQVNEPAPLPGDRLILIQVWGR